MKRAVAFDIGSRSIGIACSDLMRMFAHPVETLRVKESEWKQGLRQIGDLLVFSEVDTYVIGLPITLKNKESESTLRARRFFEALQTHLRTQGIKDSAYKIMLLDERFSTRSAEQLLIAADIKRKQRKNVIDTVAAVIILDNYLASEKMKGNEE